MNKIVTANQAASLIEDGDHVAVQSMGTQGIPMTMIRELIRQGRRDLTITSVVAGIGIDWLAFKGVMSRFCGPIVSMERFGLCQGFRRGVQDGVIEFEEYSETGLLARLGAGARNLPFGITRGMIGTDLPGCIPTRSPRSPTPSPVSASWPVGRSAPTSACSTPNGPIPPGTSSTRAGRSGPMFRSTPRRAVRPSSPWRRSSARRRCASGRSRR